MTSQKKNRSKRSPGYENAMAAVTPSGQGKRTINNKGFTLIELLVVMAIIGVLAMMAMSSFYHFRDSARASRCEQELRTIEQYISAYALEKGVLPDNLAQVGQADLRDPWGRPYVYVNLQNPANAGLARTVAIFGVSTPLNTDFDLYSLGSDGLTVQEIDPTVQNAAYDDIVRTNDGSYAGAARLL